MSTLGGDQYEFKFHISTFYASANDVRADCKMEGTNESGGQSMALIRSLLSNCKSTQYMAPQVLARGTTFKVNKQEDKRE